MPPPAARTATALVLAALALGAPGGRARADTVVLKSGKKIEDVVVSRNDDEFVVINPFRSRHPEMTWEIPDKNRIPRDKVAEVVIAEPPLVEARQRASRRDLTADDHVELAKFCDEHKLKEEREKHLLLALSLDPRHAEALDLLGESAWKTWSKAHPESGAAVREMEAEYVRLKSPGELEAQLDMLRDAGSKRPITYLERARRSAALPAGMREKVPLTLRSDQAPGGTYCIYVPKSYDPLVPTPLVVGLHGGGAGGVDGEVTGSGEEAMPFYVQLAQEWGWIVVCPSAIAAPWGATANEPLLDAVVDEMKLLYNVDLDRIYLTGHSMGGFGTFHWGPKREEVWAAYAPCAGGGSIGGCKLPVYIYHGSDDNIVGPGSSRSAARSLVGDPKKKKRKKGGIDFVYTEITGVGHGFPEWVRKDIFRFFAGRWKDEGKKRAVWPVSSFDEKVGKEEARTFGDPSAVPEGGDDDDPKLKDLIAAIKAGGGGGAEAVKEIAQLKDKATVKALARVLKSQKSSVDARVLAAHALGEIGLPESVKALAGAVDDEEWHVVVGAVEGLGRTRLPEAAEPLAAAGKTLAGYLESSVRGGRIRFDAYRHRLGALRALAEAFGRVGQPDVAVPALERYVVDAVFAREPPLDYILDDRFVHVPPRARLELVGALTECLTTLADPRGIPLLESVRDHWKDSQPAVAAEAERGLSKLQSPD